MKPNRLELTNFLLAQRALLKNIRDHADPLVITHTKAARDAIRPKAGKPPKGVR